MASPATRQRKAELRGGAASPERKAQLEKETKSTENLDDSKRQSEIENPATGIIKIDGEEIRIHKLATKYSRSLAGLAIKVMQDVGSSDVARDAKTNPLGTIMRLSAVLNSTYNDEFLPLLAHATEPAGSLSTRQAAAFGEEIGERIGYVELGYAWLSMLEMNGTLEVLGIKVEGSAAPKRPLRPRARRRGPK